MNYKILVIEDDATIAKLITDNLRKWNYDAKYVSEFQNITSEFVNYEPHLVLMDITLPFYNGFHWCTEIRKLSKVPIVFLSSASDNMNIVMAMNMGADDFIPKPFDINVLIAKVSAMLRRTYSFQGELNVIEHDGAILNLSDTTFSYNNQILELTRNEFRILELLLSKSGNIISRDEIMEKLWQSDSFIDDNTLTVNVTRLRKKLEQLGLNDYIKTKKGIGYMVD